MSKSKPNKLKPGQRKPCGCEPKGLTRALALWECAGCGHVQRAPRSARAKCAGCGRVKGANPRDEEGNRLPHPEVEYLTETTERGYFRARDSFLRCVGCLKLAPNGMD